MRLVNPALSLKFLISLVVYVKRVLAILFRVAAPLFLILAVGYHLVFWNRIYPGVKIAGVDFSGKTQEQAIELIASVSPSSEISLVFEDQTWQFPIESFSTDLQGEATVEQAFSIGREGDIFSTTNQKLQAAIEWIDLPLIFGIDEEFLAQSVTHIAEQLFVPSVEPGVSIQDKLVVVSSGKSGQEVNQEKLREKILSSIAYKQEGPVQVPVNKVVVELTLEEAEILKTRAENILEKQITLQFERKVFKYSGEELIPLLNLHGPGISDDRVADLASDLAEGINRPPQNARFVFDGGRVQEFAPAKDGLELDQKTLTDKIRESLKTLEATSEEKISLVLPVKTTKPEVLTEEVNDLGIKELIGRGTSTFRGSAASRIHNIALASSRLNGVLIKPNQVFSFNRALGDIDVYSGYQQAYIIKDGGTILGDGGGVCQVSTTFFRAALDSGLPIVRRNPHSYRVSYYEQDSKPGIDATIYSPSVDLKIKNDTPGHVLIQAKPDTGNRSLVFEFYGTSDGRVSEVSIPRVWDIRPAPPPLYQDDPTLPAGVVKQIDFAATGAKAAFDYTVTRGTDTLQDRTFYSTYRPWQAKYLRGTGL
ncbi:hypothetical protein CMO96_04470 [Candidatus Woesebacteria bacterium]|nr:hypothetical protein [Candidatus Woesebacteria bacterium]